MAATVGSKAPDFKLMNDKREEVTLSSQKGHPVVLAFFPAAFTGVCTKELCTFRDSMAKLNSANATVYGISVDTSFSLAAIGGQHAFQLRHEVEIFPDGHVGIEGRRFRQVAGAPLRFNRLVEDVEAGDNGLALGGRHVAGEDPHRRRLAGAVLSQEPENFAAFDAEGEVVDGRDAAVAFREVLNLNQRSSPCLALDLRVSFLPV